MARIFISYSRKNEDFARRLAGDLERLGVSAWIDIVDIPAGEKWSTAIQQALDTCDLMIVILSPDSANSANVEDEWQYYLDQGKPVIPVLWQSTKVHFQLQRIQYIDFANQDYGVAVQQLHAELQRKGLNPNPLMSVGVEAQPPAASAAQSTASPRAYLAVVAVVALLVIFGLIVLLSGVLSGGDGDDDGQTPDPTLAGAAGGAATATPQTTESPNEFGVVMVGMNAEYPPFEYVDENGDITGFDYDLVNAIAERAGFDAEFVNTRWDGIFVALASGEFDIVVSAATITEEREEIVDFSDPYFNAGQMIAVKEGSPIMGVDDLAGRRVGVQTGTTGDIYASEQIDGAEVVRYDEITFAFQALGSGDIAAVVNDGPVSADIIARNPELHVVLVGDPLSDELYGIAVQPDMPELLDAINAALAEVIADGTYAEIYLRWFDAEPPSMFQPG